MDRISNYREITVRIFPHGESVRASVFASVVQRGRRNNRLLGRNVVVQDVTVESFDGIADVLERVAGELRAGRLTPPR